MKNFTFQITLTTDAAALVYAFAAEANVRRVLTPAGRAACAALTAQVEACMNLDDLTDAEGRIYGGDVAASQAKPVEPSRSYAVVPFGSDPRPDRVRFAAEYRATFHAAHDAAIAAVEDDDAIVVTSEIRSLGGGMLGIEAGFTNGDPRFVIASTDFRDEKWILQVYTDERAYLDGEGSPLADSNGPTSEAPASEVAAWIRAALLDLVDAPIDGVELDTTIDMVVGLFGRGVTFDFEAPHFESFLGTVEWSTTINGKSVRVVTTPGGGGNANGKAKGIWCEAYIDDRAVNGIEDVDGPARSFLDPERFVEAVRPVLVHVAEIARAL